MSTRPRAVAAVAALLVLAACGAPASLTINLTVTGLDAQGLQIVNTVGDTRLDIAANETTSKVKVKDTDSSSGGGLYTWNLEISRQPQGQTCVLSGDISGNYEIVGEHGHDMDRDVTVTCTTPVPAHTVGGTVHGLTAQGLILAQGSEQLAIEPGSTVLFAFPTAVQQGAAYAVSIAQQPQSQICSVADGAGTMLSADIANVVVSCATLSGQLSVGITGLGNHAGLKLTNGTTEYDVPAGAGSYALPDPVPVGSQYSVVVSGMPAGLSCTFAAATGVFPESAAGGVLDIGTIACAAQPFDIRGTVAGLGNTTGLVLDSAGEQLAIAANATTFAFTQGVTFGSAWSVTVSSQPAGRTCAVSNGSGTVPAHDITDVAVTCSVNTYSVGGSISGLGSATGLQIANHGSVALTVSAGASSFELADALPSGTAYALSVAAQPIGLPAGHSCAFSGGASGTVAAANVTHLQLVCGPVMYSIGGSINGLTTSGLQLMEIYSSQTLSPAANAAVFGFPAAVNPGDAYDVSVTQQPGGQYCEASNTSGTATQDVTSVVVDCWVGYTIDGTVTGLPASSMGGVAPLLLTLTVNGASSPQFWKPVFVAGNFAIDDGAGHAPFAAGTQYTVAIDSTNGYVCTIDSGASGIVGATNVTDIQVSCH
ncbi:hypothetical protein HNQ60_005128 [Povalibacter uvarum]|uniref:Uncharacterized protein n=1 Tax=Povalibacter uvarum TaxID=732238 RepID=A0A841HTI2_9GAMM|nr:hypothetical protein [Povalibacter uvarum]MBB6096206.1 hypothetical protein [Povalibacter uvarum]